MDQIFPGISVNPFKPLGAAGYANAGRKTDAANTSKPAANPPPQVEKPNPSQNKAAQPGRGKLIDYSV